MEPVFNQPNSVQGVEILYFQEAELRKVKGDNTSFAAIGPLSVLYFKKYHRFVLQLNDWRYPLLRRLPVIGCNKDDVNLRSYIFPALNDFAFELKLNNASYQRIVNFETILKENSKFSYKGEETPLRKVDASPVDMVVRHQKLETGPKEVFGEAKKLLKSGWKTTVETLKTGTPGINSRKKKFDLKIIRNKDFKKVAQSNLKKDKFLESAEKVSNDFFKARKENFNERELKDINELKDISTPVLYISKDEVEDAILLNKDLANYGKFHLDIATGIRKPVDQGRDLKTIQAQKMMTPSVMEHYQA